MANHAVQGVLVTGAIGAGKTAVAMELGEILAGRDVATAVIDLDWLGWFYPGPDGGPSPDELIADNLRVLWPRFRALGTRYLILARAVTDEPAVAALRRAVPDVDLVVAHVVASPAAITDRLGRRDEGEVLRHHLEESAAMARALEDGALEDVRIDNESPPVRDAAAALLRALGWGTTTPSATG